MQLDAYAITRSFDAATLARGRAYFERGHVLGLRRAGDALTAVVRGSAYSPYTLELRQMRGGTLSGSCSCPQAFNCKHAAAAALAACSGGSGTQARDAADGAVDSWIENVAATQQPVNAALSGEHLRYTIDVAEPHFVPRFQLAAHVAALRKNGALSVTRRYELHNLPTGNARCITPLDRTAGRLAHACGLFGGIQAISPTILEALLRVLIGTQRLHWRTVDSPALQYEPLERGTPLWRVHDDGRQRLHLEERPNASLIASSPLWHVDPERFTAGPVDAAVAPEILTALASAPALSAAQARRVQTSLRRVFTGAGIAGPRVEIDASIVQDDPAPVLVLDAYLPPPRAPIHASDTFATAELRFRYGERTLLPGDPAREVRWNTAHGARIWERNAVFEQSARAALAQGGFVPVFWPHMQFVERNRTLLRFPQGNDERRWLRFLQHTLPMLRDQGWEIETGEDFPYVILDDQAKWDAELRQTQGQWFELDLGIEVNGERVPLLPILLEALKTLGITSAANLAEFAKSGEPVYGKLPSGAYVALEPDRIARVLATLVDLFDEGNALTDEGRLPVARVHAASVAELESSLSLRWNGSAALRELVADLAHPKAVRLPSTLKAELRPYQHEGVAWLQALREHGFGGVLADDMGLGKTVQLLAHLTIEKQHGRLKEPVLIVAPASVVPNWRSEIARFTPKLRTLTLTGADRAQRFEQIAGHDIVLTNYALLGRDAQELHKHHWSIAVLDEAQAMKNPRSKAAIAARALRADQSLALTGTPVENHLDDLWSIYAFAVPGLLPERSRFTQFFRTPIEKRGDSLRRAALAARLRPFLMRRTKERVATDLPPKTEIVERIELSAAQLDLYETVRLAMHKRVREEIARRGLARSRIVVLDALLKLRQICCDPRLLKLPAAAKVKESQKLDALLDMLTNLIQEGRRVLLFSQFTSMLDLIKPELAARALDYVELRGDTRDRETPVRRFQNREVPLFLISLKAGGTGLNLTAADTVIHYDPWWNPAVEQQATDRAHRIGQDQHVFVYKLIAEGTVEERILELQERKGALASTLFEETAAAPLTLEQSDIDRLFS